MEPSGSEGTLKDSENRRIALMARGGSRPAATIRSSWSGLSGSDRQDQESRWTVTAVP